MSRVNTCAERPLATLKIPDSLIRRFDSHAEQCHPKAQRMKILYVGELREGRTANQRMLAQVDLGHAVIGIDSFLDTVNNPLELLYLKFRHRIGHPKDVNDVNIKIARRAAEQRFDVLWLDKALTVTKETLDIFRKDNPGAACVFYSGDDMLNPQNQSRYYVEALPHYDIHFTTKSYNVTELEAMGCQRVVYVGNAYDPKTHRPVHLSSSDMERFGSDVGFVGGYEQDRWVHIRRLAHAGLQIRVAGSFWERADASAIPGLSFAFGDLRGEDYAKAICATKVNLCFLRKANRDLETTRSVEIPACGGFMLAERTEEHRALFEEGREAEYFETFDELLDKARYYVCHDAERSKIAMAGHARCTISGYSAHDRMSFMLTRVKGLIA